MILIGSRAAKYWFSEFREPNDYDIIGSEEEYNNIIKLLKVRHIRESIHKRNIKIEINNEIKTLEFEIDYHKSAKILISHQHTFDFTYIFGQKIYVADQSLLFLLKRSHLYWNIHWSKSINDYHWLKNKSHIPSKFDFDFYLVRHNEIANRFGTRIIKSNIEIDDLKKSIRLYCLQKYKSINVQNIQKSLNKLCVSKNLGYSDKIIEYYPELCHPDQYVGI